jgi:hypothetical protein
MFIHAQGEILPERTIEMQIRLPAINAGRAGISLIRSSTAGLH